MARREPGGIRSRAWDQVDALQGRRDPRHLRAGRGATDHHRQWLADDYDHARSCSSGRSKRAKWAWAKLVGFQDEAASEWTGIAVSNRQKVSGVSYPPDTAVVVRFYLELAAAVANGTAVQLAEEFEQSVAEHASQPALARERTLGCGAIAQALQVHREGAGRLSPMPEPRPSCRSCNGLALATPGPRCQAPTRPCYRLGASGVPSRFRAGRPYQ